MKTVAQILANEQRAFERVSCVDVLKALNVKLTKRGDRYAAMCPLHGDKDTASLMVYSHTNTWSCFSANCHNPKKPGKRNGGSHIDFIMQYKKCDYRAAILWMRQQFNLQQKTSFKVDTLKSTNYKIDNSDVMYYHSLLDIRGQREYFYNRGFNDETITRECFGYDGQSHIIPIWESEPRYSKILSIKKRRIDHTLGAKYIRLGLYDAILYATWYCATAETIFAFAGELDCALANQYGLPSFSLINGAKGWQKLPSNWPKTYFPNTRNLVVVFDRKEEIAAGAMASNWEKFNGRCTSEIIHYPPEFKGNDFNDCILEQGIEFFYRLVGWSPWFGWERKYYDTIL